MTNNSIFNQLKKENNKMFLKQKLMKLSLIYHNNYILHFLIYKKLSLG